ncbi:MAG: hypothetical protein MJE66_15565 [Proteobacteria bacterium]|nr:hypothetical protein [Pseudomonadota bacterium]
MTTVFAHATARQLGAFRAAVFGLIALDMLVRPLGALAGFPTSLLRPVGVFRLLPDAVLAVAFSSPVLDVLTLGAASASLLAATGFRFRFSGIAACVLVTLHAAAARSYTYPFHTDLALILSAWLAVSLAWTTRGESERAHVASRSLPRAVLTSSFLVTLVTYHMVGMSRLVYGGLDVYLSDSLRIWAVRNAQFPNWIQLSLGGIGQELAQIEPLMLALNAAFPLLTLVEICAPLALFWPRFRSLFLLVIIPFHLISLPLLGVFFYQNLILLLLFALFDRRRQAHASG